MQTIIRGENLIPKVGMPVIPDGAILVEDSIIKAVDNFYNLQQLGGAEIIDLRPYTLLPGLIDAHVHLVGSPTPGAFFGTQNESDEWLLLRACSNAREALAAGITTVRDCGGRGVIVQNLAKAIAKDMLPGPRIISSGMPITTTGGHCHYLGVEAEGVVGVQKAVRQVHKDGADFIKIMVTGGGVTPGSNSRASQYSQEELNAIVEDTHRLNKRVTGHVHGTEGIQRATSAGFDSLEHCSWLAKYSDGRDYNEAVAAEIVQKGIYVCRTIAGFERIPFEEASPEHKFWKDYTVLRNMVKAGVKLIAGSDSGIDYTPISGLVYTLETMVGLGGMTPQSVLESATSLSAKALGLEDQIGSLEIGKKAEIIAVSGNPTEDLRALRNVNAVIRNGKIMARDNHIIM